MPLITDPVDPAKAEVRISGAAPNQTLDFYIPTGPKGDPGTNNTLSIGTVTTAAAGGSAAATITGTSPSQTLSLTIPTGAVGPAGPATNLTITDTTTGTNDPTPYELRGNGMPNGVRAASPGTYYTDMSGTNGAWRWLKTSGTGNTGWTVVTGDTGIRDISSLFPEITNSNTSTPLIYVRRVNSTVYMTGSRMGLPAGKTLTANSVPVGFRPPYAVNVSGPVELDTTANWLGRVVARDGTTEGYRLVFHMINSGTWLLFNLRYDTPEAWPTTLPGTPA